MEMKKRDELLGRVEKHLLSRKEILFAYAHGSFLRGKHFRDLDIGVFLDQEHFKGVPEDYAECFRSLGEGHLIDRGLADRLAQMAQFRGRLVHLYKTLITGRYMPLFSMT